MPNYKEIQIANGKKGGRTTLKLYGKKHFIKASKLGVKARKNKKLAEKQKSKNK